jgi:hypothetical protein
MKEEKKVVNAENIEVPQAPTELSTAPSPEIEKMVPAAPMPAPLDPRLLDAINQAVLGAVKSIVAQVVPQPQSNLSSHITQPQPLQANGLPPMRKPVSKLKGIPVEQGQDLRHVPAWKINEWFRDIEIKAQQRIKEQGKSMQAQMSWTRG